MSEIIGKKEKAEILAAMEKNRIARVGISPPQVGDIVQQWMGDRYSLPFAVTEENIPKIQEPNAVIVILRSKDVNAAREHFRHEYAQKLGQSKSKKKTQSSRTNSKKGGRTQIRSTDTWISTREGAPIPSSVTITPALRLRTELEVSEPARGDDEDKSPHPLIGLLELHERSDAWCIFYRRRRSDQRWQSSEWAPLGSKQTTVLEAAKMRKMMLNPPKAKKEGHHAE